MPLILLDEPAEEVWLSLFVVVLSLAFFFDLLFEVLSLDWSVEEALLVSLEEVLGAGEEEPVVLPFIEDEPLVPEVEAAPLYWDDEPEDGLCVLPLLYVDDVVVPSVLGAFLLLCMSPSASAEPLARTMMDEKKTGASLRMWASWWIGWSKLAGRLAASCVPPPEAPCAG
ncbi:MAG TPA: hypothetical protein VFO24_12060 [Usitatibacter sp.]|nr:hypothetical protein [Usitatibacter sp.]